MTNLRQILRKPAGQAIIQTLSGILLAPFVLPSVCCLYFLFIPFIGFTFTDAADFVAPVMIGVSITVVAQRHVRKPYPARWLKFASAFCFVLAVITPAVPLVFYYATSFRAEAVLGHWPNGTAYDPKYICPNDAAYQRLYHLTEYSEAFAGWGLFTWAALMLHLRQNLPARRMLWQIIVFFVAWAVFVCEPGGRYWWWMD